MVRKELQLPPDFVLVQPNRQLIKEGHLEDVRLADVGSLREASGGERKQRTFFLFNDLIVKGHGWGDDKAKCPYRGMIKVRLKNRRPCCCPCRWPFLADFVTVRGRCS